ncbi:MAG: hypothetical protein WDN24_15325 [Sphingomonas sp.]
MRPSGPWVDNGMEPPRWEEFHFDTTRREEYTYREDGQLTAVASGVTGYYDWWTGQVSEGNWIPPGGRVHARRDGPGDAVPGV